MMPESEARQAAVALGYPRRAGGAQNGRQGTGAGCRGDIIARAKESGVVRPRVPELVSLLMQWTSTSTFPRSFTCGSRAAGLALPLERGERCAS